MTTQNYLIVEKNVVTNAVSWDGNVNTWTPPSDSIQLIQDITPAMIWEINSTTTGYELVKVIGLGCIGFIWDGKILTTNQPQPIVEAQPITTGTQTLG